MKSFKKTSAHQTGSYHIVYLNDEAGYGSATEVDGHTHEVAYQPAQEAVAETPEQQDPNTGEIIPGTPATPASPAMWIISPGPDGHTHELENIEIKSTDKKEDDEKVVMEVLSLFKTACEIESSSLKNARESDEFRRGKQWDNEVKSRLQALDRASLTINLCAKNIDELSGYQRQQRTDIKYLPVEGSDGRVADIYTAVAKNITEQCDFDREESKAFIDQATVGRGLFNIYVSFEDDLRGAVKIEKYPWDGIVFGSHEKEDLSDCEYLVKHKIYSIAKLKQIVPDDKIEDLEKDMNSYMDRDPHITVAGDQYESPSAVRVPVRVYDNVMVDVARKEFRVMECWRRVYKKTNILFNVEEDCYHNAYGWKPADIKAAATLPGFNSVGKILPKMRVTKIAGNTLINDEHPADLPKDDFFVIPVYAYKSNDEFWGKIEAAKDPQRVVNKRFSQTEDIGNKMVAYGYYYDEGTFPENEDKKFQKRSTSPGFLQKVNDANNPPRKEEGVKFPSELVQLMAIGKENVAEMMNISGEPPGPYESGSALLQKQKQRMAGNEFLFDNLSFSKRRIGRLLLPLIRKYYSPARILRILQDMSQRAKPVEIGGQALDAYTEDEILNLLSNADADKLDVVVSESDSSPTARLATYSMLLDLQQKGAQIPPELIVEFSPINEATKRKLLESLAAQQQAVGQAAAETSKTEIQKTLIAQGIIPPEVQEQMQVQAPPEEGLTRSPQDMNTAPIGNDQATALTQ